MSMSSPGALDDWGAAASNHDQLAVVGENLAMESLDEELSERLIVACEWLCLVSQFFLFS